MTQPKKAHKHWITAVETLKSDEYDSDDVYEGIRLSVFHTKQEAELDLLEWLCEELDTPFASAAEAAKAYRDRTGRKIRVEEQYV